MRYLPMVWMGLSQVVFIGLASGQDTKPAPDVKQAQAREGNPNVQRRGSITFVAN